MSAEPRFFGSGNELFGIYEPSMARADREVGIVVCNPFGRESLYAHRALRQAVLRLVDVGFHALRFDYHATGDSMGPTDDGDPARWTMDVGTAIDELKNEAGLSRVCLIGLRLGATLAWRAALGRSDVEALVLWEPVTDGPSYRREMQEHQREWAIGARLMDEGEKSNLDDEYLGFPVNGPITSWLATLKLPEPADGRRPARRALLLRNGERPEDDGLVSALRSAACRAEKQLVAGPAIWLRGDVGSRVRVPRDTINAIVDWCGKAL